MKRDSRWFEEVLNSIEDLILVKGDKSKLLWANRAFLDYYGMTVEELENIIDGPQADPDDTVQYVKDDNYVFTTGKTLDIPSEPITKSDGSVSYFHTIKTPIRNLQNEIVKTVGVSRPLKKESDIKESILSHVERKSNISQFRSFAKNVPIAAAMFDMRNRFITYSDKWTTLFKEKREIEGQFFDELYSHILDLKSCLQKVHKEKREVTLDVQKICINDEKKYLGPKNCSLVFSRRRNRWHNSFN